MNKKKRIIITLIFLVGIVSIFTIVIINKKNNTLLNNYLNNGSNLAFYYETETGEYTLGESFSSLEGFYSLNTSRSSCDNGLDTIEWDNTNKRIIMTSGKSNRCKLVFDINKKFTLLSFYPITERDAQITNMIKNGDYEEGDSYWENNDNVSVTSEKYSHGKNSLQFNDGEPNSMSTQVLEQKTPTLNHSYYGRLKFLSSETFTTQDNRFEWYLRDIFGYDFVFANKDIKVQEWTLMSNIITFINNDSNSEEWIIRNFQVKPNETSYTDELMMIDLTESYGNTIPTKAELDSELIYFDGTVDIKSITGKIGVFTVSNLPEDVEIECSNGGHAEVSGNTVTITGDSAQTTCYIKEVHVPSIFDKCSGSTDLVSCLNNLDGSLPGDEETVTPLCPNGIGGVIKHDGTIDAKADGTIDDAGDNGYRYSGCNPNNYICFGKGSEAYNRGETNVCPLENKYRIIGYVPVTLEDGSSTSLLKIIKAEYLTEDEFITKAGTASINSTYVSLERIESPQSGIPGYHCNDVEDNNWTTSSLYTSLNSDDPNGYKDKAFGDTWLNKIEKVKWNVGGASDYKLTAQAMYEVEMKGQGTTTPVDAQIGLMYAHDYGFASSSENWWQTLYNYNNTSIENRENNWMFNAVSEWTISRYSSSTKIAYFVDFGGGVRRYTVSSSTLGVRPVFYLKSDTQITGDSTYNGSVTNPFKVQ